jgi:hypothetical protein
MPYYYKPYYYYTMSKDVEAYFCPNATSNIICEISMRKNFVWQTEQVLIDLSKGTLKVTLLLSGEKFTAPRASKRLFVFLGLSRRLVNQLQTSPVNGAEADKMNVTRSSESFGPEVHRQLQLLGVTKDQIKRLF